MRSPNHLTLEQKHSFVQLALACESTLTEACRAFRISRQTGYKWLGRYQQSGIAWIDGSIPGDRIIAPMPLQRCGLKGCVWHGTVANVGGRKSSMRGCKTSILGARVPSVSTLGRLLRRHGWSRRVRPNGEIQWNKRSRFIGEAFVRQEVGLKPWRKDRWRIYFYDWLIGEIRAGDSGSMRPAIYHRRKKPKVSMMS